MPTTTSDLPLEKTDIWPEIRSAIEQGVGVSETADAFGVAEGPLRGALRRTGLVAARRARPEREKAPQTPEPAPTRAPVRRRSVPDRFARLRPYVDRVGTMYDPALGRLAGVSKRVAREFRISLGIPPFTGSVPDQPEAATEPEPAAPTPREERAARRERRRSRKPDPAPAATVTAAEIARLRPHREHLGRESDADLAARAGVSVDATRLYRLSLGIEAFDPTAPVAAEPAPAPEPEVPPEDSEGEPPLEGAVETSDGSDKAAEANESPQRSAEEHPEPENAREARATSVAPPAQAAPVGSPESGEPRRQGGGSVLDPFRDQLGKEPDHIIAERAGVARRTVVMYRKRHGIGAYNRHTSAGAGPSEAPPAAPVAREAAAATSGGPAPTPRFVAVYTATLDDGTRIAVPADTLADAAHRVSAADLDGRIVDLVRAEIQALVPLGRV